MKINKSESYFFMLCGCEKNHGYITDVLRRMVFGHNLGINHIASLENYGEKISTQIGGKLMTWTFELQFFDDLNGLIEFHGTSDTFGDTTIQKIPILETRIKKFIVSNSKEYYSISFNYCCCDYDVRLTRQQILVYLQLYSMILQNKVKEIIEFTM